MRVAWIILVVVPVLSALSWGTGGCTEPTGPRTVANEDLTIKVPAIKEAARDRDKTAVAQLVTDLESDDPALRMYAIRGLHEITGQDFGYEFFADVEQRRPAVMKWRQWLEQRQGRAPGASTAER